MARILVVEENRTWQGLIREALCKERHQLTFVEGAAAALLKLMEHGFDILLVDGKFSYDLLHTCWLRWPGRLLEAKIIITPADAEEQKIIRRELGETGLHVPDSGYLLKPYTMEMLRHAVRAALSPANERVLVNN